MPSVECWLCNFSLLRSILSRESLLRSTLGDRLWQAIDTLGVNQIEFAEKVSVSRGYISLVTTNKREVSELFLLAVEHVWGISREWLKTGKGDMFTSGRHAIDEIPSQELRIVAPGMGEENKSDFELVPLLEDRVAAGSPRVIRDEMVVGQAVVYKGWLEPGRHIAVKVDGDSMEPVIADGAICVINLRRADPRKLDGKIVAVNIDDAVTVKRLRIAEDKKTYVLMPENHEHLPIIRDAKDLKIIGAVEFCATRIK